ncbi:MAG: hypothetical protein RLZZ282_1620 [Verrucomicrobiota bacterium]
MLRKNLRQDAGDSRQDGDAPHPAIEGRGDRMIFSAIVIKGPVIVLDTDKRGCRQDGESSSKNIRVHQRSSVVPLSKPESGS